MGQEISVNLDPAVDFDFQGFNEVSQINFDPSFFDWGLNFSNFSLNNFQVGNFFIEKIKIWNGLSASFQENVFFFDFLFTFNNLNFRKVGFEELSKSFLWTVFPKVRVLFQISLN